jgi:hypothetical protein
VSFISSISGGGSTPTYQWFRNGVQVATTANFTSTSLTNNDTISCILTSNDACANITTKSSNKIVMTINPSFAPTAMISATATAICPGTQVDFTVIPTNAGMNPTYSWYLNNNLVATTITYTTSLLNQNDSVRCVVTPTSGCSSPATAVSNTIKITNLPAVIPTISITPSANNLCSGQSVTFTTSATNSGATPTYQWKINGSNVGSNNSVFASSTIQNNDIVTVEIISSMACASPLKATSNAVVMIVNTSSIPSIGITTDKTTVCENSPVIFTASYTNGGGSPLFVWKRNGVNIGTSGASITISNLQNKDTISCLITSGGTCPVSVASNKVIMTVNPTPATPLISMSVYPVLRASVTGTNYNWMLDGNAAGSSTQNLTMSKNGKYTVQVEVNGCWSDTSLAYIYTSSAISGIEDIKIFAYPNPTADKLFIKLPNSNNNFTVKIIDKNGRTVHSSLLNNINGNAELNTDMIASGVYTIEVSSDKERGVIRLSVVK